MRVEVENQVGQKRNGVFKKFELTNLVLRINAGGWGRDLNIPKNGIRKITDLDTGEDVTESLLGRKPASVK